jgi:hypothetical protein
VDSDGFVWMTGRARQRRTQPSRRDRIAALEQRVADLERERSAWEQERALWVLAAGAVERPKDRAVVLSLPSVTDGLRSLAQQLRRTGLRWLRDRVGA